MHSFSVLRQQKSCRFADETRSRGRFRHVTTCERAFRAQRGSAVGRWNTMERSARPVWFRSLAEGDRPAGHRCDARSSGSGRRWGAAVVRAQLAGGAGRQREPETGPRRGNVRPAWCSGWRRPGRPEGRGRPRPEYTEAELTGGTGGAAPQSTESAHCVGCRIIPGDAGSRCAEVPAAPGSGASASRPGSRRSRPGR